jgi:hypothetical protein
MPYGMPSWNSLVLELLFEQAQGTRRLGSMLPHYRRAVAAWMTDYFGYSPLVLARMVERQMRTADKRRSAAPASADAPSRFLERLRDFLYRNHHQPKQSTALDAVADLVAGQVRRPAAGGGVDAVVTFNFDDLLERELKQRRVPFQSITDGVRPQGRALRVIHVHGFVPQQGPIDRSSLIFTEPDYHRLTESPFHWALSEIVERLRKNTVLFVGLSMSDPSLRRLLDAGRNSNIPAHWQIQKRHQVRDHEAGDVMADIERRAQQQVAVLGGEFSVSKNPSELQGAMRAALEQADAYDREVFEGMGVKTIWVEEFDQIQNVLAAIRS